MTGNGTTTMTVLQQQQQQHLEQIEALRRQLQEQQSINQQQQQQLVQQMTGVNNPSAMPKPMTIDQTLPFGSVQLQGGPQTQVNILQPPQQGVLQPSQAGVLPDLGGAQNAVDDQPRFQLQPHVLAQIQALTGEIIELLSNIVRSCILSKQSTLCFCIYALSKKELVLMFLSHTI